MRKYTENIKDVIKKWDNGEPVWTAELGGMGPGYEQAIQICLFEIISRWGDAPLPETKDDKYPEEFTKHVDKVVHDLDKSCCGFSGGQVSAAKGTAWQFMKYGYSEMMNKLEEDRAIMVSRSFPHIPDNKLETAKEAIELGIKQLTLLDDLYKEEKMDNSIVIKNMKEALQQINA